MGGELRLGDRDTLPAAPDESTKGALDSGVIKLSRGVFIDRYHLLLSLARGGMAELWVARQIGKHGFDKLVTLKTILPRFAADPGFRDMFLDEARLVSRIAHPHVAQTLDLGEERGVLFLVVEWVDGESLATLGRTLANGSEGTEIPEAILARIVADACSGVHAAHELTDDDGAPLHVVHRDVSPHNTLVGFRGEVKVIDFGIAKARNRATGATSDGVIKGKIAYMAPEQAMGLEVDRRTDVWGLGALLYRFLAHQVPYHASNPLATLKLILSGRPPPPLPASVSEPLRRVVEKALALDASDRYQTADEMRLAIEDAAQRAGDVATSADVAALMTKTLGAAQAARARAVEEALRRSRAGEKVCVQANDTTLPYESGRYRPSFVATNTLTGGSAAQGAAWQDAESGRSEPPPTVRATPMLPPVERDVPDLAQTASPPGSELPTVRPPSGRPRPGVPREPGAPAPGRSPAVAVAWLARRAREARALAPSVVAGALAALAIFGGLHWRMRRADPTAALAPSPDALARNAGAPLPSGSTLPETASPSATAASLAVPIPSMPSPALSALMDRARRAQKAGHVVQAWNLFAQAAARDPSNADALTHMAETEEAQGLHAQAIVTYRQALVVDPGDPAAHLGLADALWANGDRADAARAYRIVVDTAPPESGPPRARERAITAAPERIP